MALAGFMQKGLAVMKAFGTAAKRAVPKISQGIGGYGNIARAPFTKKLGYYVQRDIGVNVAKNVAKGTVEKAPSILGRAVNNRVTRGVGAAGKFFYRGATSTPGLIVGAAGMMGLAVMKGGMNQARDIVHERYMQDYTYSTSMLHNSRVGLTSGTNKMLNRAATQGLSNALHKTRHGKR